MTNLTKIFRLLLVAVFCCVFGAKYSLSAHITGNVCKAPYTVLVESKNQCCKPDSGSSTTPGLYFDCIAMVKETVNEKGEKQKVVDKDVVDSYDYHTCKTDRDCTGEGQQCIGKTCQVPATGSVTNKKAAISDVSGCSADYGLFSGLITAGGKIFTGLRELIYVVAGFGIIGVSVGGFFGNLNYKWLGAIVISLVVIATTGELINAITGCETFTTSVITDTLK